MHSIRPFARMQERHASKLAKGVLVACMFVVLTALSILAPRTGTVSAAYTATAPSNTAVTTYKNDNAHTGQNSNETLLTTSNVNKNQFGKRVSYPVDAQIYAQPLFMPNVAIKGSNHNTVFVATENDSIYAFDADSSSVTAPLWKTNFTNSPSVVAPSNNDVNCGDTVPLNGLTGTPVIDTSTGTLYVVALTKENGAFVYRLHALDIKTGNEKPGSPTVIQASVPGTGAGSVNGTLTFNPQTERQRAGLILSGGKVYIAWASFCDNAIYHGWIMSYSYNGSQLQQVNVYTNSANDTQGGIWGSGGALAADASGNIYYTSGNGTFNPNNGPSLGDSFVKLNSQLQVQDYFTPFNQQCLDATDGDLGSGGTLLLPNANEMLSAGKQGRVYVVNTGNMGKFTSAADPCNNEGLTNVDHIAQETVLHAVGGLFSTPAYWNGSNGQSVYIGGNGDPVKAYKLTNGQLSSAPTSQTSESFSFTGGNPVVSSNGTANGIVWIIDPNAVLRAYDATDLSKELYNSGQNAGRDGLDSYVKFTTATVANGEVFVGTKTALTIYGVLTGNPTPNPTPTPTPPPTAYNNTGTSDDSKPSAANFDGFGGSYSKQALQVVSINPGDNAFYGNVVFTWPNALAGSPNNYVANGQTLPVTPVNNATKLAFAGSSSGGSVTGTAKITYTDGSTQAFSLGFSDWTLNNGAATSPSFGNGIIATLPYRNNPNGKENVKTYVFYADVALQSGKTVKSVTLPSQGQLHVFAITTK